MKTTMDKAGRVVIPAPIRALAGLHPGTELEVVYEEGSILTPSEVKLR
jgi:AbrB family looped-hinge helix DNA binding protein